ncbi:UDP-N-acetylmuramate--L-alanine ligase [Georgenia sp. TF02-10]|uniref:UDP-N-acetylmuramate--L-alanine ligase n=1 Tax=Georgenia sp. TF02-10 TaxID=2917725 RepID=UPI001FA811A1|nr:UDP-N-acetylmuramate--L-alanine ligase [Georgenia sp. TF02-10]UNX55979.1 UDP-N-acetylmuramate--L-alanine ligase [Georgenia sp. TF02-10]
MAERYHLIGVGGAGMSALAELLRARGHDVSGSDQRDSAALARLRDLGVRVYLGHDPAQVPATGSVVVSTAVRPDNPELVRAHELGRPVLHRSVALARAAAGQDFVAVAGAHGKTTTSAMLAVALRAAGQDPSYAIGGTVLALGTGAHLGTGRAFVAEADESDGSFLAYRPRVAVVTNVEPDHLDHYGSAAALARAFEDFAGRVVPGGLLVAGADDPGALALARHAAAAGTRVRTYGTGPAPADLPHLAVRDVVLTGAGATARLGPDGVPLALRVGGEHMVRNAAAAWCAGVELGVAPAAMATALGSFTGTGRRFETRGTAAGVRVVDDYAHHPTEIAATLAAARLVAGPGRVLVLFQPHLYSRTQAFAAEFAAALSAADAAVVTDVYAAREDPVPGVDGSLVTAAMEPGRGRYVADKVAAARAVADDARPGDLVLTVGAGDVTELGAVILDRLRERA